MSPSRSTARGVEAQPGELLIKVAQEHGTYIPRFCWHERMKPVGMCRMCLVEVEGVRGLPISCATPVADGMVVPHAVADAVKTDPGRRPRVPAHQPPARLPGVRPRRRVPAAGPDARVRSRRVALRRGEAPLGEADPDLSDLVLLDRERCIQCGRCTRFADEIAGDPLIDFGRPRRPHRGASPSPTSRSTRTSPATPCRSARSARSPRRRTGSRPGRGTSRPSRRRAPRARCSAAARCSRTSNRLVRLLGVDSEPVNHGWLCDKGRYGIRVGALRGRACVAPDGAQRRRARRGVVARGARRRGRRARSACSTLHGPGVDRGARRRARHQRGRLRVGALRQGRARHRQRRRAARRRPARRGRARPAATPTIADSTAPRRSSLLGARPQGRAARSCYLRVARAPRSSSASRSIELAPRRPRPHAVRDRGRSRYAARRAGDGRRPSSRRARGDGARGDAPPGRVARRSRRRRRRRLGRRPRRVADACGRGRGRSPACPTSGSSRRCAAATCTARSTSGSRPGFLPGRVTLDAGREWFAERVGRVPAEPRASTPPGSSTPRPTARSRRWCCSAPTRSTTSPTATSPQRGARRGAGFVIAVDAFVTDSRRARRRVPARARCGARRPARVTNLEGRVQRVGRKVAPEGTAMDDWRIAAELALRLGTDFDLATVDEVRTRSPASRPRYAGVDADAPAARARRRRAPDRRAPRRDRAPHACLRSSPTTRSWEPIGTRSRSRASVRRSAERGRRQRHRRRADRARTRRRRAPARRSGRRGGGRSRRRAPRPRPGAPRVGPRRHGPGAPCRATRTLCASWPAARSTTAGASCAETPVARRARARAARCSSTRTTSPASASTSGDEVRDHLGARHARRSRCVADRAVPVGVARHRRSSPTAPAPRDSIDVDARRHRPARGDAAVSRALLALDPLFDDGVDHVVVLVVIVIKVVVAFVLLLVVGDALHLVPAQGHRRHAEPHRARPRRAVRRAPDASPTASSCSSRSSRSRRPPTGRVFRLAPYLSILPAFLVFCIVPDRRRGLDRSGTRRTCSSPTSRSACCGSSRCRASALRRDARRLVVGLEVPAARLGARVRAAALATKPRSGSRSSACCVQAGTLSTRGDRRRAGVGRLATRSSTRVVLAPGDRARS